VLLGRDIEKMSKYDFFEGLTDPQIDELLASCTKMRRNQLKAIARDVHLGIHPILGAAGTGKTTVVLRLLKAALISSKKKTVLVCSNTNAAVNNICRSAEAQNSNEDYLYVRLHHEQLEQETIGRYDPSKSLAHRASSGKKSKQREKYHEEGSLARRVLQVARV
jgi:type II secretory pathway predicted ATPase ExeA